ncbi:MAG: haloacid dehalogenase type II [Kiloniellales bacterium]|nr:haloacid dehalogenase type II [Kiloniellales bacterium]
MADPALQATKACVFDAYGTLFDVHAAVARGGASLGERADAVSALWRQKQLEYTWLRSLMRAHVDFWQVTGDALDYALASHGVEDAALKDNLMALYRTLDAYPDVTDCLTALRRHGKQTAILSNGAPEMLNAAVASAGIAELLDEVLSIESVGIYKPDPKVYQLAVDRLGVKAEEICFVSNNAWDSAAAAHFGFKVARLNRFGMPQERLPGDPVAEMKGLAELTALLGL